MSNNKRRPTCNNRWSHSYNNQNTLKEAKNTMMYNKISHLNRIGLNVYYYKSYTYNNRNTALFLLHRCMWLYQRGIQVYSFVPI